MRPLRRATVSLLAATVANLILGTLPLGSHPRMTACAAAPAPSATKEVQVAAGRDLFNRNWLPNDPRGRGGDGLGPLYNAASCVDCHRQGGAGGAGPVDRN